uniref:Glutathione S-transferase omega n=1 Tax=Geotrypetes seraphini TaxID=260995 RepID=A0A6P8QNR9_GEOSA|nr:glutathione S-transferase omega-1-like isoform X3 [Geotrypetes seraphini]
MPAATRSLQKGSAAPGPVPAGLTRIYSMRFCPYAHRAVLVLEAKGIKYETINVNLISKPEWFLEKTPLGLVPALETEKGQVIYESPIICDYLDEAYPEKKLNPVDPYEKAKQKMLLENFSKLSASAIKIIKPLKTGEELAAAKAAFKEHLIKFQQLIPDTLFLGGDSVSMIDYMVWPWFERLSMFGVEEVARTADGSTSSGFLC